MNRRVLFIASDFPPLAGTNTQRVQSFVRHFPKLGWEPIVITRAIEDLPLIDSSQLRRQGNALLVHRLLDPDVFARLKRSRGERALDINAENTKSMPEGHPSAAKLAPARSALRAGLGLASEAVMFLCRHFSYLPDALAPWAHACVKRGVALCAQYDIHVVIASAPSYSCLVAGLAIARKSRLPFVADFRDLWVGRPYRHIASRWHDWWDRRLERRVVMGAQRIIVASPPWIAHFHHCYGESAAEKCVVITNGYDESLIDESAGPLPRTEGVTTFLNTGAMYGSESPAPFLEALGKILHRRSDLRDKVRVRLIGYSGQDEMSLRETIRNWDLDAVIELTGAKPHDACLIEQTNADVLLLFSAPGHGETIRGKSFEYMSTGKPILALIPSKGIQAEILRSAGTATIVEHGDIGATEQAIEAILIGKKSPAPPPNWPFIRSFERATLARKLAQVMDELALSSSSSTGCSP